MAALPSKSEYITSVWQGYYEDALTMRDLTPRVYATRKTTEHMKWAHQLKEAPWKYDTKEREEKAMPIRLTSFEHWQDDKGWRWEVDFGDGRLVQYRTDSDFEGLWVRIEDGPSMGWRQMRGHMQFRLSADRGEAKAKVLIDFTSRDLIIEPR